jgi:hypothetical protein
LNKGFLTIAYGAPKYIRMGKALARSIRYFNTLIPLAVITDSQDKELISLFDFVIPINPRYGSGVKQKLFLDQYTPFEETIFIDSDCLVYRDPAILWEMYKRYNRAFCIKGWGYLGPNDNHYSVTNLNNYLSAHNVNKIGAFNSGLFYFDSSKEALAIFKTARTLCDDKELKSFKNSHLNDEPVFAMAMELNQCEILPWDSGDAMSTALGNLKRYWNINILKGRSVFIKNGYQINPVVIHFNVQCQNYFIYRRDIIRLEFMHNTGIDALANIFALPGYLLSRTNFYISRISDVLFTMTHSNRWTAKVAAITKEFIKVLARHLGKYN